MWNEPSIEISENSINLQGFFQNTGKDENYIMYNVHSLSQQNLAFAQSHFRTTVYRKASVAEILDHLLPFQRIGWNSSTVMSLGGGLGGIWPTQNSGVKLTLF